jgi:hypothetical protein
MIPDNDPSARTAKLVGWKRHEQPPPGFFEFLPPRILRRIEALKSCQQQTGWAKWLSIFESQPVLLGALSTSICGLFLVGITLSQWVVKQPTPSVTAYRWIEPSCENLAVLEPHGRSHTSIAVISSSFVPGVSAASPAVYTSSDSFSVPPGVYTIR